MVVVAALLIGAVAIVVAVRSRAGAQRQERTAVLVETIRAEAQQLNAARAQALATFALSRAHTMSASPQIFRDASAAARGLSESVARLRPLDAGLAKHLGRDLTRVFDIGVRVVMQRGQSLTPAAWHTLVAFAAVVGRLDAAAQSAATRETLLAASASAGAQTWFVGSLGLGLLVLMLSGWVLHRLRRRIAVDAAVREKEDRSEARLRALLEHASDMVAVVGTDLHVHWQATPIAERLGIAESLEGRPLTAIVHPEDVEAVEDFLGAALTRSGSRALMFRAGGDGRTCRTVEAIANNRLADPEIGGLVLSMRDATERKALEDQLRHHAYHDALTGLANRSLFENRVAQAVAVAQRSRRAFAVLFLDLDDFKTINDSLGHFLGDELLCDVATRIVSALRGSDTAARLGGDEFAVLVELRAGEDGEAMAVAERILEVLSQPFQIGEHTLRVTASLGVVLGSGADGVQELMRNSDIAMYAAKADGKSAVRSFEPDMYRRAVQRLELTGELRAAIDAQQFVLDYQPIVELDSGRIVGVEALVRWEHPAGKRVRPDEFIGLCEDTGLIVPLGRWILSAACAQAQRWRQGQAMDGLELSVNVSTRQLRDPAFVADVAVELARSGLPPAALMLEITESVMMGEGGAAIATLRELRALGVRIAIDDFGTGYSSLSHLRHLPVDALKIDRSFIAGIENDPGQANLVRGILDLGASLQLKVVVEGIELAEQARALAGPHRPLAQGFLFHRPLPAEEVEQVLAADAGARVAGSDRESASRPPQPAPTSHPAPQPTPRVRTATA